MVYQPARNLPERSPPLIDFFPFVVEVSAGRHRPHVIVPRGRRGRPGPSRRLRRRVFAHLQFLVRPGQLKKRPARSSFRCGRIVALAKPDPRVGQIRSGRPSGTTNMGRDTTGPGGRRRHACHPLGSDLAVTFHAIELIVEPTRVHERRRSLVARRRKGIIPVGAAVGVCVENEVGPETSARTAGRVTRL